MTIIIHNICNVLYKKIDKKLREKERVFLILYLFILKARLN